MERIVTKRDYFVKEYAPETATHQGNQAPIAETVILSS